MTHEELDKLSKELECSVNCSGHENGLILSKTITGFHRTLQQKFFGDVVLNLIRIKHNDYVDGIYDERNEVSCKIAHDIWEYLKNIPEIKSNFNFGDNDPVQLPFI